MMNRRGFGMTAGWGASAVSLQAIAVQALGLQALASEPALSQENNNAPHHPPTAKSVVFLFMSGGPSQVDTFDPKPELARLAGKDVPESIAAHVPKIKRAGLKNLMASPWEFNPHGESGIPVSTLLPRIAEHVDDLCVIRSMSHRNPVHGPGECVALTGTSIGDRPSLGAWSIYGLGSETDDLPAFITMNLHTDGMQNPQAAGWGTGFLPSRFQGTVVNPLTGIQNTTMPSSTAVQQRSDELRVLQQMNRQFLQRTQQSELDARIRSYEMAFQMQTTGPELFDLNSETGETHSLYGVDQPETKTVGRACLLARRMVQRGVRFVQIRVGGWDAHGNILANHTKLARRTDAPIAALLTDLKRTGLLDSTLVVWGGEFGRTPTMEGRGNGRDHSPAAYSVWMAGGGIRGGHIIGESDPIGYTVTERPVTPVDMHATILHAMGIDSQRLQFNHHGLIETPLGVTAGQTVLEAFNKHS
ncbi:DUF1501 domain-containing protein [Stieleria varia]|nr:DUF1501 domain-containing protein [Stieleria varia]